MIQSTLLREKFTERFTENLNEVLEEVEKEQAINQNNKGFKP